ncbi:ATP-binding protein [Deinococcus marmoris]|uniref:ATP-binding protein n=1 Tax=Deinococcus marmoris TaxID=249408 RepID=UPI0009DCD6E1|nr:ATP-binding protein [Deinococcus marmoris]
MPLPSASLAGLSSLSEHLQHVTENLAAASTQDAVFAVILTPALEALQAIAGAILLVNAQQTRLNCAATRGEEAGAPTIWSDGPLSDPVPAADVLRSRKPLFFEHAGAVQAAYPELEARTGARASVASAVLPMFLGQVALGSLVIEFREPHTFTPEERAFLRTLASQCAVALGRVRRAEALERRVAERTAALEAFARFTTAVGTDTDVLALARVATLALRAHFPEASVGYYEQEDALWKARVWTEDVPADLAARLAAGITADTPMIAEVLCAREAVFKDAQAATRDHIKHTEAYTAVANTPLLVNGEVYGVLSVGLKDVREWQAQDQAIVHAVEMGLNLALERAEQARQLDEERTALRAFTTFTEQVGVETDVPILIQRAASLLQQTRAVDVVYFQRDAACFRAQLWSEGFPPDVLGVARAGYPLNQPHLARAERERDIVFEEAWDPDAQGVPESALYRAAAFQPFFDGDVMTSVMVMASQKAQRWTERDRGIFRAVGHSLDLALKRAAQAQTLSTQAAQLAAQRDTLDARTRELSAANEELEAFAQSASHDLRTPVRHITAFVDLARKALSVTPNEKVTRHLEMVQQAADRMSAMIDAMLSLSRAGAQDPRFQMVDLNALVAQAQRDVQIEFAQQRVHWELGPLPQLVGDRDMLQQVMTNLLSNAVKYSSPRAVSEIRIWAEERDNEWIVSVQDNGVGFNPNYAHKLFGVFQRLHSERDFGGTGVGLATMRRIILKHGGRVFAQSSDGAGATFGFTLPLAQQGLK